MRISFATEGHCFWLRTVQYERIVSGPTANRGAKGTAFQVPADLIQGGVKRSIPLLITIAAAFVRPQWTLVFVDHQCFMTFHVMRLRRPCTLADFIPKSAVSPYYLSVCSC